MSTGWVVFIAAIGVAAACVVLLLLLAPVLTDRDPMPEGVGLRIDGEPEQALAAIVAAPPPLPKRETQSIPDGPIFEPVPLEVVERVHRALVHGPTLPPYVEGWAPSSRCEPALVRTAETPTPIGEAPIYDELEQEWPSLFYRRDLLHQATREFKILVGLTWTQAELDDLDLVALAEPCSHCVDDRDHRACVGCACPCTVAVSLPEGALV